MSRPLTRRTAVKSLAAGALAFTILPEGLARGYAANEKLNIALVGCGGRGSWFIGAIPQIQENLVALCDVNQQRAAESFAKLPDVPKFTDYRKMLEEKDKQIDAVIVAAPDHIHAPCGVMAMKMGKHLYCEKPLTNTINEARTMRETARATGVATQMGNQGTATHAFREQVEIIRAGGLGDVREVFVWNAQGGTGPRRAPTETMDAPPTLAWDLWLGPRAFRPYHREWMKWHTWREFGTCQLGNWAVHSANMQFMGLNIHRLWEPVAGQAPPRIRVRAEVPEIDRASFPKWEIIHYDIPARGDMPPVTVHWYNGLNAPGFREKMEAGLGRPLEAGGPGPWNDHAGCLAIGSQGTIHSTGHNSSYTLLPKEKYAGYQRPQPTLPRSGSHEREWARACRGGPAAMSNFDYGAALTEFVLLGNVATQFDRLIEYDPINLVCVGDDEATAALRRDHRDGWKI
jgi:hypothetical protein